MVQIHSIMLSKPNSPFKCLRPLHIKNKYTGEDLVVGCGTCKACLKRMSDIAAYKCKLHSLDYRYNMFVTLTYSNDNVPLLRLCNSNICASVKVSYNEVDNDFLDYEAVDVTPRFIDKEDRYGTVICHTSDHPFSISQLHRKFKYFDDSFPYLSKYDAQCFLKRFRKNISKITDEKITYYLVGEYGPVHFRPHFHVIFSFDSEKIFQAFGKLLHKSWTFGNIDFSLAGNKCSNYVAKYVNSRNSCPRLYSVNALRPFCLHSSHYAERFYKSQKEKVYENVSTCFDDFMRQVDGRTSSTYPWRSLVSLFFPKCKGYGNKSPYELFYSYRLISEVFRYYQIDTMSSLIDELFCDMAHDQINFRQSYSNAHKFLLRFLLKEVRDVSWSEDQLLFDLTDDEKVKVKHRLYSVLHLSLHFHSFVCDNKPSNYLKMFKKIIYYYSHQDYKCLTSSLQMQEDLSSNSPQMYSDIIRCFYDNVFLRHDDLGFPYIQFYGSKFANLSPTEYSIFIQSALSDNSLYQTFLAYVNEQFNLSVKHKKLNDANDIFCNSNV